MIFNKTSKTIKKRIWRNTEDERKKQAIYRVTTYWLLFVPLYSKQECIDSRF